MMSHFVIEPVACTPASGWEKGQVERQVRTLRKQIFEPLLSFASLDELNAYLLDQCKQIAERTTHPDDRHKSIAQALVGEQTVLTPCTPYEGYHFEIVRVNSLSLFHFDAHKYSVPNHLAGKE